MHRPESEALVWFDRPNVIRLHRCGVVHTSAIALLFEKPGQIQDLLKRGGRLHEDLNCNSYVDKAEFGIKGRRVDFHGSVTSRIQALISGGKLILGAQEETQSQGFIQRRYQ